VHIRAADYGGLGHSAASSDALCGAGTEVFPVEVNGRMTRTNPRPRALPSARGRNATAILVAVGAVGLLQFNLGPTRAGADSDEGAARVAELTASASAAPQLPLPPPLPTEVADEANELGRGASDASVPAQTSQEADVVVGRMALLLVVSLLENGAHKFSKKSSYTATLLKQERIHGELSEPQIIDLKLRHEPFSVYLKWHTGDKGRELLFVEGQNDGKMIVHAGGLKGRLLPALKLDPHGSMALAEARYPVTRLGMLELARTIVEYRSQDITREKGVRCQVYDNQKFDDRECYYSIVEYDHPRFSPLYRKSIVFIDKELLMPICVKNFTWAEGAAADDIEGLDESTLIEFYSYSDIRPELQLADNDFDRNNEKYGFKRR
jgi:hypothetical protein